MLVSIFVGTAALLIATPASLPVARGGRPTCETMAPIQLADDKFTGNVAQYIVDLHDSKAPFDFCGGACARRALGCGR